jgi:hypothetical protein
MALNRAARSLVLERLPDLDRLPTHDWWCYLAISACGRVICDDAPTLLYRQHGGNTVGMSLSLTASLWRRGKAIVTRRRSFFPHRWMAEAASECLSDRLDPVSRQTFEAFLRLSRSPVRRLRLALSRNIWRQQLRFELISRVKIAMGLI